MIIYTGVLPWIALDLLQRKTQCLFAYISSGFVNHYFPVESQNFYLSRPGFVNVQYWKNSIKSSISQLCLLFILYLRFIITLAKGVFDLQIDKKKKKNVFNEKKLWKKNPTAHSQNILHVDVLYNLNIKRKK